MPARTDTGRSGTQVAWARLQTQTQWMGQRHPEHLAQLWDWHCPAALLLHPLRSIETAVSCLLIFSQEGRC